MYFKVSDYFGEKVGGEDLASSLVDNEKYASTIWYCVDVYHTQAEADRAAKLSEPFGWTYVADADGLDKLKSRYGEFGVMDFDCYGYDSSEKSHICWTDDTVCEDCAVEYVPLDEVDIDVIDIGNNETLVIRASKEEA